MKSFLCLLLALQLIAGKSAQANPPNVLLITADDLGWDSLGCTGNTLEGISPNLDRLAAEGILIEHCHIATPICGPSREALYSGQYPQTNGYMGHGVQPPKWWKNQKRGAKKSSITTALKDGGYITGLVGKHGSTACKFTIPPFASHAETGMGRNPDKYYQFARDFLSKAKSEAKPFFLAANAHDPHRYWARHPSETQNWIKVMMGDTRWQPLKNGKPYPDPKSQFNPADCPVPPSYPDESRIRQSLAHYYDSVNRMDEVVGEVLRALKESGLAENTVVMFLSDHGLAWQLSKWSLYPSGTKTPLIARWPGKINPGTRDKDSVLSVVDIAPTIADICSLPAMAQVDGVSFRCLLDGRKSEWKRTEAFSCFNYMNNEKEFDDSTGDYSSNLYQQFDQYRPSRALSSSKFTYIWNGWSDQGTKLPRTMGTELPGLLRSSANSPEDKAYPHYNERVRFIEYRVPEELYDTTKDPGCLNNLVNNPEYKPVIEAFQKRMDDFLKKTNDHELENYQSFTHE